jgi:hypothetical protein
VASLVEASGGTVSALARPGGGLDVSVSLRTAPSS